MSLAFAMLEQLPHWFVATTLGLLGAIWGSFVAALCQRWPLGESIIGGRSRCDHCKTVLRAQELVPVLSFGIQRGRCRTCGASIGTDSLVVELAGALVGSVCAFLFAPVTAIAAAVCCWLLIPLIILDWRHNWLPDALLLWLAGAALLIGSQLESAPDVTERIIGGIVGYAVLETLRRSYSALRGIDAMGAGDPKMFGALGLWLGWLALPLLLLTASLLGLADFARRYVRLRQADIKLPLGSYLGLAAIAMLAAKSI